MPIVFCRPNDALGKRVSTVTRRVSVVPAMLKCLKCSGPCVSFKYSLLAAPADRASTIGCVNNICRCRGNHCLLRFSNGRSITLCSFISSHLLRRGLLNALPRVRSSVRSRLGTVVRRCVAEVGASGLMYRWDLFMIFKRLGSYLSLWGRFLW